MEPKLLSMFKEQMIVEFSGIPLIVRKIGDKFVTDPYNVGVNISIITLYGGLKEKDLRTLYSPIVFSQIIYPYMTSESPN